MAKATLYVRTEFELFNCEACRAKPPQELACSFHGWASGVSGLSPYLQQLPLLELLEYGAAQLGR